MGWFNNIIGIFQGCKVVQADAEDLKYLEEHGTVECTLGKVSKEERLNHMFTASNGYYESSCGIRVKELFETSKGKPCKKCVWALDSQEGLKRKFRK